MRTKHLLIGFLILINMPLFGQNNTFWTDIAETETMRSSSQRQIVPAQYRTMRLDLNALQQFGNLIPHESHSTWTELSFPFPDGSIQTFAIAESPIMDPKLADEFPNIKTFIGTGIDDPTASMRFDWTPKGFHAIIFSSQGVVYIDPYEKGNTDDYICYFKKDFQKTFKGDWPVCHFDENNLDPTQQKTH